MADGQYPFLNPFRVDWDDGSKVFLVPPSVAAISLVVLLVHLGYRRIYDGPNHVDTKIVIRPSRVPIFLTTACCIVLLGFEVYTALRISPTHSWIHSGLCATYAYASLLGVLAFSFTWFSVAQSSVDITLLSAWAVYACRDVWPLLTYHLKPLDVAEGPVIWVKISILTLAAIAIPAFRPRLYVPYNPAEPAEEPNPEQTASILSSAFFSYMDPVVLAAARTTHLSLDQLPPLSDTDYMKNLEHRSFSCLDPLAGTKRHIFWKLIYVFLWEHFLFLFLLVIFVATTLASPFAMNRILSYLESDGEGAVVRPWVWILVILIAPMAETVFAERYMWLWGRVLAQVQAVLTQVIFDHALRIRLKAGTGKESTPNAAADTPDNRSTIEETDSATAVDEIEHRGETQSVNDGDSTASATSTGSGTKKASKPSTTENKNNNMIGKINNLVTTDLNAVEGGQTFLLVGFFTPCAIIMSMAFLYQLLGWSIFVGTATMLSLLMVTGFIARLSHKIQVDKMKKSDSRVELVTEVLGGAMRMIKLFGWESKMSERIDRKRQDELKVIRKFRILSLISNNISDLIGIFTMAVTFATYTLVMKETLTASRVFSSMALFSMLQNHFKGIIYSVPAIIQGKVALDRVNEFLLQSEMLDAFDETSSTDIAPTLVAESDEIGIRAATFTWSKETDGSATPSGRRNFKLHIDNEVFFKRGHINIVIGQTASGKTSLLMALLGEMHYIPMGPTSTVSLPRKGGVAYHAQESWVLNETIRNNILFGSPYDEDRYKKVIQQCALERDLSLFDAGDETEVGEKGITLSGGQKARITLARAVYSTAEILLLDDVLAALDVHTSQWIVEKCFQGDLVKGRTVILVTHNVALATPIAEFVVALKDGRIISQGSLSNALEKDKALSAAVAKETKEIELEEATDPQTKEPAANPKAAGKLVVAEEISEGHVGWKALKLLFSNMGIGNMSFGSGTLFFWLIYILPVMVARIATVLDSWILGRWSHQYEIKDPAQVSVTYYLSLYMSVVLTGVLLGSIGYTVFVIGTVRASRVIHRTLIDTLLRATLRWLDKTPTSRIITRCTQDIAAIDGPVVAFLLRVIDMSFDIVVRLVAVVVISPVFVFPGIMVGVIMAFVGQLYMKAQLAIKRERSNARSPVLGHFGAAIAGLVSIRAYGAQAAFRSESFVRIDRYTRATVNYFNLNRWMLVRGESLVGFFAASLAAYLVYGRKESDAAKTGFSLTMAIGFSTIITWWIRIFNEFEVSGNSLERIQQYLVIDQEPKATPEGVPPAHWPSSGELRVENLSARYYEDGPKVLDDISFHVKSGERVGIVGRTGSGKSSLTLALLRCILTEGGVYFDGVPTNRVNLDALRAHITIIPQNPELLTGTLRANIDPFEAYDDALLNDALRAAGLYSLQGETAEGRLTLDSPIASGGGNLSVGQRQIIALARAIVRQSKLLILDEATSAIDYDTDAVIQESLRREVAKDVTLLSVAHRLQTIMDADKIMVLDAGRIAEFGEPSKLLANKKGFLRSLVDASGDKEKLYAMAGVDVSLKDRLSKTLHDIAA